MVGYQAGANIPGQDLMCKLWTIPVIGAVIKP